MDDSEATPEERCFDRVLQHVLEPLHEVGSGLSEVDALAHAVRNSVVEETEHAPRSGGDTGLRRLDSLSERLSDVASATYERFRAVLGKVESELKRACSEPR